jgi:hypothetical protein
VLVRLGEAEYSSGYSEALRGTQGCCTAIEDLGREFEEFGIPSCDDLEDGSSEMCRLSENSTKLHMVLNYKLIY